MAASSAAIANLALSHLGGSAVVITNLATDTTLEGKACRAFYDTARIETFRAYPWQVAQRRVALTLVQENSDDPVEWLYTYRVPENCLQPQRLLWQGIRNPVSGERIPFRLVQDTESTTYDAAVTYQAGDYAESVSIWYRALRETINDTPASSASDWAVVSTVNGVPPLWLLCDVPDAVLEYTGNLTDTRFFTADMDNAIAARLAFYVAPKLSNKDQNVRVEMARLWDFLIGEARSNDFHAEQRDPDPPSSFEAARDALTFDR